MTPGQAQLFQLTHEIDILTKHVFEAVVCWDHCQMFYQPMYTVRLVAGSDEVPGRCQPCPFCQLQTAIDLERPRERGGKDDRMPFDKSRYPDNWDDISRRIRNRDGWKCKWCGLENGAVGARDKKGQWYDEGVINNMNSNDGEILFGEFPKMIKIVLTVAHLGVDKPGQPGSGDVHDKMDCRDENLVSLCQKCHLNYDRDEHILNAAITRRRRKIEAGQLPLL